MTFKLELTAAEAHLIKASLALLAGDSKQNAEIRAKSGLLGSSDHCLAQACRADNLITKIQRREVEKGVEI